MARPNFQGLRVYRVSEEVSDRLWGMVRRWSQFDRDTVGKQLVRAAGSVGANIAEGSGRGSLPDNMRFVKIARGSYNETLHFLRRAYVRELVSDDETASVKPLLDELGPTLNAYLRSMRTRNAESAESGPDKDLSTKNNGQK